MKVWIIILLLVSDVSQTKEIGGHMHTYGDVVFLFDTPYFELIKTRILDFASGLVSDIRQDGVRVAAVGFSYKANGNFDFLQHRNKKDVIDALRHIEPSYAISFNITGGLRIIRKQLFQQQVGNRPEESNLCIMFVDLLHINLYKYGNTKLLLQMLFGFSCDK